MLEIQVKSDGNEQYTSSLLRRIVVTIVTKCSSQKLG
jgi:hypothetical protein